ncbi:hypothetical protein BC835DRAFT_1307144 [Cytidiella melzeri]|nr:hypothetical protein BC835DRAFT_1307144 [Cytidiella melzeri]
MSGVDYLLRLVPALLFCWHEDVEENLEGGKRVFSWKKRVEMLFCDGLEHEVSERAEGIRSADVEPHRWVCGIGMRRFQRGTTSVTESRSNTRSLVVFTNHCAIKWHIRVARTARRIAYCLPQRRRLLRRYAISKYMTIDEERDVTEQRSGERCHRKGGANEERGDKTLNAGHSVRENTRCVGNPEQLRLRSLILVPFLRMRTSTCLERGCSLDVDDNVGSSRSRRVKWNKEKQKNDGDGRLQCERHRTVPLCYCAFLFTSVLVFFAANLVREHATRFVSPLRTVAVTQRNSDTLTSAGDPTTLYSEREHDECKNPKNSMATRDSCHLLRAHTQRERKRQEARKSKQEPVREVTPCDVAPRFRVTQQ